MPIIHLEDGLPPSASKVVTMGGAFNDSVGAYGEYVATFTPPKGKKWVVTAMRLSKGFPAGGASGVHSFEVKQGPASVMLGESVYGSNLDWLSSAWTVADSRQLPASDSAAILALRGVTVDESTPLIIRYFNGVDVSNSKLGEITVHVLESPAI